MAIWAMSELSILGPLVKHKMQALGFTTRANLRFTMELAPDIHGSVGLNTASRYSARGTWDVNPVIAVHHLEVARIRAELTGRTYVPYMGAPVSRSIGYLMPAKKFMNWPLGDFDGADHNAEDMVGAIREYGLPFMHSHATNETILEAINEKIGIPDNHIRDKPILLALMGRFDEAAKAMADTVEALPGGNNPAADGIRSFAANFHAWLDAHAAKRATAPSRTAR
ncbi:hypothetical protein [Arthrobacter sp. 35W]|uniref:hypothetical protein n=1 Tax=Arthrobacter sp. 35W TaxID=1132441 RepID=UPI0003FDD176|nr:hypothetical protein [Arthrobacter sp. 35W]